MILAARYISRGEGATQTPAAIISFMLPMFAAEVR
jgi:hypothetical protein